MKGFLSNSIGGAAASQVLLRLLAAGLALLLLACAPEARGAENFVLRVEHLPDRSLADALGVGFNLDERAEAGLLPSDPASNAAAMEIERARMVAVMRGFGYLQADAVWHANAAAQGHELVPATGPQFAIGAVAISVPEIGDPTWGADLEFMAEGALGSVASGDVVGPLVADVVGRLEVSGFPFARLKFLELTPDPETDLALVRLEVDPGQLASFGQVELIGGRAFTLERLVGLLPFSVGERYSPEGLEVLGSVLAAQPELRSARISIADEIEAEGSLAVSVRVREAVAPGILTNGNFPGQVALLAVLALLALRQVTVAAGGAVHSPFVLSQTILGIIALALAAWFVARRFVEFAGIG
jgi:hypothetical protein